jgi:hypothetical protein
VWAVLHRWTIACVLAYTCTGIVEAQQSRPRPIVESAARIARETWPVERGQQTDEGVTIFRTETYGDADAFRLPPPWLAEQRMGPRMPGTAAQRERLSIVTPEAFRGSVMYPAGVGIDPAAIVKAVKYPLRKWQEHRVRERIRKEVEALGSHFTDEPAPDN